jgi:uncharacterized protein with GYD domain
VQVFCLDFHQFGQAEEEPTKETSSGVTKILEDVKKEEIRILGFYWTLSRYDTVLIFEAPSEKEAMELSIDAANVVTTETMIAIPREEAIKLL